jgi:hypothetical protein
MINSSDTIGDRTRDFRACSAVPQPNAPPCANSDDMQNVLGKQKVNWQAQSTQQQQLTTIICKNDIFSIL